MSRGVPTASIYKFLGELHRSLIDELRQETPDLRGPRLAAAVLTTMLPELAPNELRDAAAFFSNWRAQYEAEFIPKMTLDYWLPESNTMEIEDLRWVGLGVLVAIAGGVLLERRSRKGLGTAKTVDIPPRPAEPPKPIRTVVSAIVGKVRGGVTEKNAGDLLTSAAFWWSGSLDDWETLVRDACLSPTPKIPESDDALVFVVYDAPGSSNGTPTSRLEGASRLREVARSGDLRLVGTFTSSDPAQLIAAGFRR